MKIYVNPDEVWNYFQKNKKHLENALDLIAEVETDGEIYLQIFVTEEKGYPQLTIECGDEILERECAISESDCSSVSRKFFKMIEDSKCELEDDDNYRECEILDAFREFIYVAFGISDDELDDDMLYLILDSVETALFEDFGFIIDRDQYLENEEQGELDERDDI